VDRALHDVIATHGDIVLIRFGACHHRKIRARARAHIEPSPLQRHRGDNLSSVPVLVAKAYQNLLVLCTRRSGKQG
jgi:hypothetical protein